MSVPTIIDDLLDTRSDASINASLRKWLAMGEAQPEVAPAAPLVVEDVGLCAACDNDGLFATAEFWREEAERKVKNQKRAKPSRVTSRPRPRCKIAMARPKGSEATSTPEKRSRSQRSTYS